MMLTLASDPLSGGQIDPTSPAGLLMLLGATAAAVAVGLRAWVMYRNDQRRNDPSD